MNVHELMNDAVFYNNALIIINDLLYWGRIYLKA